MAQEGKDEVLYLTRSKLCLFDGTNIFRLDFPQNLVRDVDVKDKEGFRNLVTNFIVTNNLIPAQLYFVISESICFRKDIDISTSDEAAKADTSAKEFIDTIPFSMVVSKIYKYPNNISVVGTNQDLIDTIFMAFGDKGFGISSLVPASMFPGFGTTDDLTQQSAQEVLNKKDVAVDFSMVGERTVKEQKLATSQNAVPKNKLLPYLIGIFVTLIIVFLWLMFFRG